MKFIRKKERRKEGKKEKRKKERRCAHLTNGFLKPFILKFCVFLYIERKS